MRAHAYAQRNIVMEHNLLAFQWSSVLSVLLAILILLVMITIHEFGHYLAGKIFHFKINEFSIGFGPALFKRKRKNSDELFSVRLIPLGGYCAFDGEDGLEEQEEAQREAPAEPFEETAEAPAERGDASKTDAHADAFTKKPPWQRIIVLIAGAFMNYALALVLILISTFAYGQTMVQVRGVKAEEEYVGYSLREGDVLLQIEGRNLYLTTDIAKSLNGKKQGDLVEIVVSREGEGDQREEQTVSVMLRADVEIKNSTQVSAVWKALGIGTETREDGNEYYQLGNYLYRFGFFGSIGRSFVYSFKIAGSIFQVLGELLTGKLGISAFGGPITTITMTSQIASQGFHSFLEIASYIGVNLAVFNLLPIPALDGSKVVFTAIEWIRKKPISRKVEAVIHAVGFVLLLGFAVLVDILQFV